MAKKHLTRRRKSARSQHSVPAVQKTPQLGSHWLTDSALEAIKAKAREEGQQEVYALISQRSPRLKSAKELQRERIEAEGFTLKPAHYEQAERALGDASFALRAIRQLAWEGECAAEPLRGAIFTGIQHAAIGVERYLDLVLRLLDAEVVEAFGDIFTPKRDVKADEAEAQHAE